MSLRLGGQIRYRLADVESYELEKLEVVADTHPPKRPHFTSAGKENQFEKINCLASASEGC